MVNADILVKKLPRVPLHIHIILTTRCNLRCRHCYGAFGTYLVEKNIEFWKDVLEIFGESLYVNISGGEPTTYPKFRDLIEYLEEIELPFFLTTNGVINDDLLNWIIGRDNLLGVKISLDGISDESYLFIRDPFLKRRKIFERVLKTLQKLSEENIYIVVGTLIHSKNLKELKDFPKFLSKFGVKKWILGPLLPKGRGKEFLDEIVSNEILEILTNKKFWEELEKECKEFGIEIEYSDVKYYQTRGKIIFECGAGIHYLSVFANGDIYPCPLLPYCNDRLKRAFRVAYGSYNSLEDIWFSLEFKRWRSQQVYGCPFCKERNICFRCPVQYDLLSMDNIYEHLPYCYVGGEDDISEVSRR